MLSNNNQLTIGGGGRQRQRGYCRVSEPACGFFVTGSSLEALNGVYVRKNPPRVQDQGPKTVLYYEHEDSLWKMALNTVGEDEEEDGEDEEEEEERYWGRSPPAKKPSHEWLFLDEFGQKRFRHGGDTSKKIVYLPFFIY
jgi:hypothetical protein